MKNICYYFSFIVLTTSCAGFRDVEDANAILNKNNLDLLDGTYGNFSISNGGGYVRTFTDVVDRNTNMFIFRNKYNERDVKLQLKMISQKKLNVKIYKDEKPMLDKDLKVKLKDDGFLYLKEKRFMMQGIPLVFGGWNIQKSRFTVDEKTTYRFSQTTFFAMAL